MRTQAPQLASGVSAVCGEPLVLALTPEALGDGGRALLEPLHLALALGLGGARRVVVRHVLNSTAAAAPWSVRPAALCGASRGVSRPSSSVPW